MWGQGKRGLGERLGRLSQWPRDFVAGIVVALVSIAAYAIVDHIGRPDGNTRREGERISAIMKAHDKRMSQGLDMIAEALRDSCLEDTLQLLQDVAHAISPSDEYCYYIFCDGDLRYWHNAMLPSLRLTPWEIRTPMTVADNGLYYVARRTADRGCSVCILLRVWRSYPYSNDYLTDGFDPSLGLPSTASLSRVSFTGCVDVVAPDGEHLFSVDNPWATSLPKCAMVLCIVLLIVFTFAMFWAAGRLVKMLLLRGVDALLSILAAVGFYAVVYVVMLNLGPPWGGEGLLMFSAIEFSHAVWLPSYWMLATLAACDLHLGYVLFRVSDASQFKLAVWRGRLGVYALTGLLTAACVLSFLVANGVIEVIVRDSHGLSFYAGEIDMSETSVVKVSIIGAAVMAFLFTAERCVAVIMSVTTRLESIVALCVGTAATAVACLWAFGAFAVSTGIGFAVLCATMCYMERTAGGSVRFSHFVWLILLTSGFTLLRLTQLNEQKEHDERRVIASSLSFQMMRDDDPIAEQLLPQMSERMKADSTLKVLMAAKNLSHDDIYSHIRNRYFNSYFSRYDLQVIPCRGPGSTIQMTTNGDVVDCVTFFSNWAKKSGRRLPDAPDFYCISNGGPRPCYLATLNFDRQAPSAADAPNRLFLQIDLKSTPRTAGYPELLTNKRDLMGNRKMKGYSYAKYDKTRLAFHHGNFEYPATVMLAADGTAILPASDDATHYTVRLRNQQNIVVTYPKQSLGNILTCFSYTFIGLLIVSTVIMVVASRSRLTFIGHMNIRERIHASLVFFIVAFFFVMCVISGYQAVVGYEALNKRHLSQAMSSFCVALSDELGGRTASDLTQGPATASEMDYLLQSTSNATGADAHLFDAGGHLIGTSRRELFLSGIAAPLMNSEALAALRYGEQSEAYVQEHLGSMVQYAAYTPIYNAAGQVLGYVNVPLFNDVGAMRSQVIASIEPMTNSLVFIVILSIIASAALARGITRPLLGLRDMLKRVDLQSADVRLTYPYDDEVGQVVSAYNKMNDKLRAQAEKLAATERESTWR